MGPILKRKDARRPVLSAVLVAVVAALAWPSVGLADPAVVTRAPDISGKLNVGQTLQAVNGAWSGPADTTTGYTWRRCQDDSIDNCTTISRATEDTYELTADDLGKRMRVTLWAVAPGEDGTYKVSDPTDPVADELPGATPTPTPGTGTPAPAFNVSTPVPTVGPATKLPSGLKLLKPTPVVRIKGKPTSTGAKITLLTVQVPKGAKVTITCSGKGCPVKKYTHGSGLAKATKFQRSLKAGIKLTVTVSRSGYVSRVTVITIRKKAAPKRADSCLLPGKKKTQSCPSG